LALPVTAGVVIAGGGVIGTAIAWRAALAGLDVVVVDPDAGDPDHGRAASLVAAGMLAPASESLFGEGDLLRLNLLALRRFPDFAAELEAVTGQQVGVRREGTLAIAYDAGDYAALMRLTTFRRSAGLDAEELDSRACRKLEPFLTPDVHGGVRFGSDWSVDNRRYAAALRAAARAAGARIVPGRVTEVRPRDGGGWRVRLVDDGEEGEGLASGEHAEGGQGSGLATGGLASGEHADRGQVGDEHASGIDCGQVVVAAGCWTGEIAGLPGGLRAGIRPVKGQLLRLRHPAGLPPVITHTIRATVRGTDIYLVPRADGELVVGATQEERGDDAVTAGAVHDLLRDALSVLPVTSELELAEVCAGLRPGTADNGPIVGPVGLADDGLLIASGHFRNGILMSAATADAAMAYLTGQQPDPVWSAFTPGRIADAGG
jgi:glycine oxidase